MKNRVKEIEYCCHLKSGVDHVFGCENNLSRIMILKSECTIKCEDRFYQINPDSVLVLPPNSSAVLHSTISPLVFDGFLFQSSIMNVADREQVIDNIKCVSLSNLVYSMKKESFDCAEYSNEICLSYMQAFFYVLKRVINNRGPLNKNHDFYRIRDELYNRPDLHWTVEDLVSKSNLSRRQFYYSWHHLFKRSPYQEILNVKLEYARSMMLNTSIRLEDISELANFSSIQQFTTVFKKTYGITPSKFRTYFLRYGNVDDERI